MLKKGAVAIIVVAVVAVGLYLSGLRVALDGSGVRPRFVGRQPDYDALEADRARQRQRPPLVASESEVSSRVPEAPRVESPAPPPAARADAGAGASAPAASRGPAQGFWPDFRGSSRDGEYREPIRTDWPQTGLPLLWKQPVGVGYGSFVVADGRAFTIEQRRHQEVVAAYDIETGRELWTNGWEAEFTESMGGDGPRATPTYHDGRIYALGAIGELRCLDARSGAVIWRRNILDDNHATNLEWGMAAAPLIVDEKVIVLPGGPNGRSVVAYHAATGKPIWSSLDDQEAYTSPMLVTLRGVRQLLIVSAKRVAGLTVDEGRLLWEHPWVTFNGINVAQPLLVGGDRVFVSAGYGHGAVMLEITRAGDTFAARSLWENTRMKNKFSSSVVRDGYIYGLDEAILACLDAATGELKWKGGRYGYGQIMLAGDRIIVLSEDGDVAMVMATPDRYQEIARFMAIEGKTWNYPVIAAGRLLVRNVREMAAFDISPK